MTKIDDGGPAFPNAWTETNENGVSFQFIEHGLSIRDWFAGQALSGLYASRDLQMATLHDSDRSLEFEVNMAKQAYLQADAMISARKGNNG